jgi:DNA-binding CsgD family transcriptional regulator
LRAILAPAALGVTTGYGEVLHSFKATASDLGVSISTISAQLAHLAARLGLKGASRVELMAAYPDLFSSIVMDRPRAPSGIGPPPALGPGNAPDQAAPPIFLSRKPFAHEGREWAILSYPMIPREVWECLTVVERVVATLTLRGLSNKRIAAVRHCSPRTVANEVASIFRKLGVFSRAELIAHILSVGNRPLPRA